MFEKKSRKETVLKGCKSERKEAGRVDSLTRKVCAEVQALFCGGHGVLEQGLGLARRVKSEMRLPALR